MSCATSVRLVIRVLSQHERWVALLLAHLFQGFVYSQMLPCPEISATVTIHNTADALLKDLKGKDTVIGKRVHGECGHYALNFMYS